MAISFKNLRSSSLNGPPRILIHGVEGLGKTSLAAEFPEPVYLSTAGEATPAGIDLPSPGTAETWDDITNFIGELATEKHDMRTLIVDAVDGLEELVWRETCRRNKWGSIEDPGYGKGYIEADSVWRELLDGCDHLRNNCNMTIVLIAHSARVVHEEPGHPSFTRYDLRLQKRAQAILTKWTDFIFYIGTSVEIKTVEAGFNKKHTHAEGGGSRWIYTDARPHFVAKNRAASMPAKMMFKKGQGFKDLAPHIYNSPSETQAAA